MLFLYGETSWQENPLISADVAHICALENSVYHGQNLEPLFITQIYKPETRQTNDYIYNMILIISYQCSLMKNREFFILIYIVSYEI